MARTLRVKLIGMDSEPMPEESLTSLYAGDLHFEPLRRRSEIAQDGTYEFALRRWPEEVDRPITAAIPDGKAIAATTARLKIGEVDLTKPIPEDSAAVTFRVELAAGKSKLQTWLVDDASGESRGAYYVYVERVAR